MANYRNVARQAAQRYGLDPNVFLRQINQESGFNPNARSPAGAIGIAQFMPGTARGLGVNPSNPRQALYGAAKLMAGYVRKFGSYRNALIAYNAGPGAVGHSLPGETRNYLATILGGRNPATGGVRAGGRAGGGGMPGQVLSVGGGQQPNLAGNMAALQLLQQLTAQKQQAPVSSGLTAPAFSARPALPSGFQQTPGSSQAPGPQSSLDVGSMLGAIQQASAQQPSGPSTGAGTTIGIPGTAEATKAGGGLVQHVVQVANAFSAKQFPYAYGGGHGGRLDAKHLVPVDCSGAVSAALGINPRVSGAFLNYGQAGKGKHLTIWVRPGSGPQGHVLLEVNGRFFGTSAANPGGGAGWIPRGRINAAYLHGLVARHPAGS